MFTQAERYRVPRGSHDRITGHMEQMQTAWVEALAAAAGCLVWKTTVVDDGLDVLLEHHHSDHTAIPERVAVLGLQLKSTTLKPSGGFARARVSRMRFREYATVNPTRNVVVVIMTMPSVQPHWVYTTERCLSLYGSCYWVNLAGESLPDDDDDDGQITVRAPLQNVFTDVSLAQIMERVGNGGRP